VRSREQGNRQLIVVRLVQLEKPRAFAISFPDVLNRLAASCGQAVRQIKLFGYFCHGELAEWVVDFVDADGREADGRGNFVSKDLGGGVALVGVLQHARDDAVAVEGLSVGEVCGGHACVGGGVVPAAFGELFFGALFELAWILGDYDVSIARRHRFIFGCVLPVLNGGTLPSLLAQKLSRWYSAYSGVVLWSLFGLLASIVGFTVHVSATKW
jgi:hypothetical protein